MPTWWCSDDALLVKRVEPQLSGFPDAVRIPGFRSSRTWVGVVRVRKHQVEYLARQDYLSPYPAELMLRNHV
jgi:hypothetical protein